MGNLIVDIMPPAYWQDFERLTLDFAKHRWQDDFAERNGRQGQEQAGVDVYGYNYKQKEHTGIQCKKRVWKTKPGFDTPSNTLSTDEIDKEIELAKGFAPALERFIISTTAPRDSELQEHVRKINKNNKDFSVSLMFWEDYVDFLNDNPEFMYRYYENILKYRSTYKHEEHYYRLLSMAFDRPAIRTPFHLENRATYFIEALSATQNAITTGCLKDRDGRVIDQARVPSKRPKELHSAAKKLQSAREISTKALSEGRIIEHSTVIEIPDQEIVKKLNDLRFESVALLNKLLESRGLPTISIDT
ncbi:hypothetical protein [Pseudomonas sp. URIL14HWK12:I5]|uniref:hypothetical protein n=1 Tax=Pseudomonas sp. URIL14HWK12:I5 TaxID=1261630 RepID=UPI0009D7DAD2|nr:hypothetical protein [Pseudomonas sp. URIL14HWK12:I5]SMD13805.1 hypothetical protein SAMN05660385_04719 [Pseudomonas sp. URIL14HWK12:I5]